MYKYGLLKGIGQFRHDCIGWKNLKMNTAQVIEKSVTNSSFQNYPHPDDHTRWSTDNHGFKPFTIEKLPHRNSFLLNSQSVKIMFFSNFV